MTTPRGDSLEVRRDASTESGQRIPPSPGASPHGSVPAAPFATRFRRRPNVVEAMQWTPQETSMQDVLTWLREAGETFKTVGRQLWIEFGETPNKGWMVVHPGDYVIRKTEGRRYFYSESAETFENEREVDVEAEVRKALAWIQEFAAKTNQVGIVHTGFTHIERRARAALEDDERG